jgi:MSHA biogenesis protein MshI
MEINFIRSFFRRSARASVSDVIEICDHGVHFAQVKFLAGRPRVTSYVFHQVPGSKSSGITPTVLDKIRKSQHFGDAPFSYLLAPADYQLLQTDAPNVPEDEMKSAVRWTIKDMLTVHVDDATLDILHIPTNPAAGVSKKLLYVVAAPNELIKQRASLLERAHIKLSVIDIPEMAQRNIAALYEQEGRALALLAFNESGCLLTFTSAGELYLARRIEISPGQLQDANETLREQFFDRLELELQRSMDHFDRQFNYLPVRQLLVSAPANVGLIERLSKSLDLSVERINLNDVIDLSDIPALTDDDTRVSAFYALGAALRQESQTP